MKKWVVIFSTICLLLFFSINMICICSIYASSPSSIGLSNDISANNQSQQIEFIASDSDLIEEKNSFTIGESIENLNSDILSTEISTYNIYIPKTINIDKLYNQLDEVDTFDIIIKTNLKYNNNISNNMNVYVKGSGDNNSLELIDDKQNDKISFCLSNASNNITISSNDLTLSNTNGALISSFTLNSDTQSSSIPIDIKLDEIKYCGTYNGYLTFIFDCQ